MAGIVFFSGPHIEQNGLTCLYFFEQCFMPLNASAGPLASDFSQFETKLYKMRFGNISKSNKQTGYVVTTEGVDHEFSIAFTFNQMGGLKSFQVSASKLYVDMCLSRNMFNGLGTLREQIKQL